MSSSCRGSCRWWDPSYSLFRFSSALSAALTTSSTSIDEPKDDDEGEKIENAMRMMNGVSTTITATPTTATTTSECSSNIHHSNSKNVKKKLLYRFHDARHMARNYGFTSRDEYIAYECPGAYQLPKNPDSVYDTEWQGWDDWLGIPLDFDSARKVAQSFHLSNQQEYLLFHTTMVSTSKNSSNSKKQKKNNVTKVMKIIGKGGTTLSNNDDYSDENEAGTDTSTTTSKFDHMTFDDNHPIHRLPYRPDLYYRNEFNSWDDWLTGKS
jgi:hypothetical protein